MKIKCVIWDLDNTIWDGELKSNRNVQLKKGIRETLNTLYEKGIIQSIASKNYYSDAIARLKELEIDKLFVYPQISYTPKNIMIKKIIDFINIDQENVAFIDDDQFELDEVKNHFKSIKIYQSNEATKLITYDELNFDSISSDGKKRTEYLKVKEKRNFAEENFKGEKEEFLRNANTNIIIEKFSNNHIDRVYELINRTNKYNNFNKQIKTKSDILEYSNNVSNTVLVFKMNDIYGEYGTIGTMFYKIEDNKMYIDLFSISCRILGRGIAIAIFSNIINSLISEKTIKEVICHVEYTKKNRETIVLLNLLDFKLINDKNDDKEFVLNRNINKKNENYINIIFKENLNNGK